MINFGPIPIGAVLPVFFSSYGKTNGESITLTGLAVTDVEIYKGTSMTQRASDAGYALIDTDGIDIDSTTGIHGFSIDTGDNTDSGFYASGSFYTVVVSAVTVDSQTVNFIAATFRCVTAEGVAGQPKVDLAAAAGTAITATGGRPEVNTTHAAGTAWGSGAITAASIASDAITAAKVADGTIDAATFAASAITATAIAADAITAAKIADGAIDAATFAANAITSTVIANDAITDAKVAADVTIASVTGAVGSVTGAVGSVGTGGISAASFAAGAIDAAAIAANAIGASEIADGAIDAGAIAADAITAAKIADGAIDAATFASGAITADAIAANAIGASELAQDAAREIADEVLDRDLVGGASGNTRNVRNALRALRNRVAISAGTATVYQEDDSTSAWTAAITTTAGDPISEVNPA